MLRWLGIGLMGLGLWLGFQGCGATQPVDETQKEAVAEVTKEATGVEKKTEPAQEKQVEEPSVGADASEPTVGKDDVVTEAPQEPAPTPDVTKEAPVQEVSSPDLRKDQEIAGGSVEGSWCGQITVKGLVTIDDKKTLTICAGSRVVFARSAGIVVIGTLKLEGRDNSKITMTTDVDRWTGLQVTGTLTGSYAVLEKAQNGVNGRQNSKVTMDFVDFIDCQTPLRLESGGVFKKVQITGGGTVYVTGGMFEMTDSFIDLKHPKQSPDCTDFSGGGIKMDHVRITGCHCPIHINKTTLNVSITNSVFDNAAYPVMIAKSKGVFKGNHFLGGSAHILDIGGGSQMDVSGNYWDGAAPKISTSNQGQFTGTANFSKTKFQNVGPR